MALSIRNPKAEKLARQLAAISGENLTQAIISALEKRLEVSIVIEAKKGEAGGRELDALLKRIKMEIIPFDHKQSDIARQAWRKYGKGRHQAGLNIGDCCSYALSKVSAEPILFKGSDFSHTDLHQVEIV